MRFLSSRAQRAVLVALLLAPAAAQAQREFGGRMRRMMGDPNEFYTPPDWRANTPYDGRFTFARIKYRGYSHWSGREGPGWSHDYPRAESHFMKIIKEITTIRPFIESETTIGSNILALDDPELFKYPVAYLSEPGGWNPTEKEVLGLRNYLLKGGFIIFDDFDGGSMDGDWLHFLRQMQRVLPTHRVVELDSKHPIFDSFFKIDLTNLERSGYRGEPRYFAIFENNDPKKRIMAVVNFNNDIGEYWQWSDQGLAIVPTNEAYKLGVNYLIYALTH